MITLLFSLIQDKIIQYKRNHKKNKNRKIEMQHEMNCVEMKVRRYNHQ